MKMGRGEIVCIRTTNLSGRQQTPEQFMGKVQADYKKKKLGWEEKCDQIIKMHKEGFCWEGQFGKQEHEPEQARGQHTIKKSCYYFINHWQGRKQQMVKQRNHKLSAIENFYKKQKDSVKTLSLVRL